MPDGRIRGSKVTKTGRKKTMWTNQELGGKRGRKKKGGVKRKDERIIDILRDGQGSIKWRLGEGKEER